MDVSRAYLRIPAMNCRALGAQGGLPSREELEDFLQRGEAHPGEGGSVPSEER